MAPTPRTSPMMGKRSRHDAARSAKARPMRVGPLVESPRLHLVEDGVGRGEATGLPPKVPPRPPTPAASMTSARPVIDESGRPPAMDLAAIRMSGTTPGVLDGEQLPRSPEAGLDLVGDEQDPVAGRDLPELAAGTPRGGTTKPPSPSIGSTMTAATLSAAT